MLLVRFTIPGSLSPPLLNFSSVAGVDGLASHSPHVKLNPSTISSITVGLIPANFNRSALAAVLTNRGEFLLVDNTIGSESRAPLDAPPIKFRLPIAAKPTLFSPLIS